MLNYIDAPKKIQFELSNLCNALCLGCVRTDNSNFNEPKSFIKEKKMVTVETFRKIISSPVMSSVEALEFCGTIDEPLMHPDFFKILETARDLNPRYRIIIHTNASLRSIDDWRRLAYFLKKFRNHRVQFSIDGIGEEHEFYRQNTNFKKIIENAKSFIEAGGIAVWQFLVFPWNRHQLDQAKQMSEDLKFHEFVSRIDRSGVSTLSVDDIKTIKIQNKKSKDYGLDLDTLIGSYIPIENYSITCRYKDEKMYFINYDSRLWPCCFISNGFLSNNRFQRDFQIKRIYDNYGLDFNDTSVKSIEEILDSDFYRSDLVLSWDNNISTEKTGKLIRCAETCNNQKLKVLPIGKYKEVIKHYE